MNEAKHEKVHHVFQTIYKKYDFMNSLISFNQHKAWRKKTMAIMNVQKGASALDLCCGTGDWALSLAEVVGPKGKVAGLDFSDNMLKVAEMKLKETPFKNVTLDHGDAMNLPYKDNTFDYVTIGFGLRNVPDYLTVLKEMQRVLKPGGMAVCLETSQPTMPVYTQLYFFYFKRIMPILGKIFAGSYDEYVWLHESTKNFPDKKTLAMMFEEAGLTDVRIKPFTGGIAAMHHAVKPEIQGDGDKGESVCR
ncbi:demethylmenaquinone methyltransferase/2-methoxy-6-polyprenyl-1,4-benzoquinol methylase [Scopulibacillus darangshiensis]|uniref:Demethylmenaquinone methyltransferase n=1 Tax=Scopulibacillus darangshiensis TaxID=442528 RepID=A0A4R2P9Q1_9BACL|nr:demethylmenaquinone methyltransferase [Scopulibacillus darangshiensis]TCP31647.1 demethylmenaquinone methyltransferase/2-methoxy-6-polyprenyl-1,4-benzoquinol methylase [Scopulibacillus darangshiensis]